MILRNQLTHEPMTKGEQVQTFDGEEYTLTGWCEPHKPSSTGRVYLTDADGGEHEFFPGVINAHFEEA